MSTNVVRAAYVLAAGIFALVVAAGWLGPEAVGGRPKVAVAADTEEAAPGAAALEGAAPADRPRTPADLVFQVGQSSSIDGGALQLTFVGVDEDSRCPRQVACIRQGRAVVRFQAVVDGIDRGVHLLTTLPARSQEPPGDTLVDPYALSLIEVSPYPTASQPTPPEQIRVTVRVTGGRP